MNISVLYTMLDLSEQENNTQAKAGGAVCACARAFTSLQAHIVSVEL